jgi:hypothetical protein
MAKKTKKTTTVEEEVEEGTREVGEEAPRDDSEILSQADTSIGGKEPDLLYPDDEQPVSTESEPDDDMVEVAIDGALYSIPKAAAEAYSIEQQSNSTATATEPQEREDSQDTEQVNYEELLFTDPNEALRLHGEEVADRVTKQITGAYQQDQSRQIFWNDFYEDSPELKEETHIVRMVMEQHWDVLKDLKGKTVRKKLAELTQKEILRLANKQKGIGSKSGATTTALEGDTQPATAPATEEDQELDHIPPTLNAAIRERNKKRRESSTQKQA